jgi:peptidyl-prolyl cis-trans isomerase C
MSCSLHSIDLPKPKPIRINGEELPRAEISREAQYYPAEKPIESWHSAAKALVVRHLMLSEAKRQGIAATPVTLEGRTETGDEAMIRELVERAVITPEPDEASCLRYYENNRSRFRSATIYEAGHILVSADKRDATAYRAAQDKIEKIAGELRLFPDQFGMLAEMYSDCSSASQQGNLGQLTAGQTTPEFEAALVALAPGAISGPVASRYGLHVIRLKRKIEGKQIPFETVRERIADYLQEAVQRRAAAQYIALLISQADIEGIDLAGPEAHRVN